MSLLLDQGTEPENLPIKTLYPHSPIMIGDYKVTMEDFVSMVRYVLRNSDLVPDDPRLKLCQDIKNFELVKGWNHFQNKKARRIKLGE